MKSLTHKFNQSEKIKLLQEAAIMGQFHHPNVLQLYGVVVDFDVVNIQLNGCIPQLHVFCYIVAISRSCVPGVCKYACIVINL